MKVDVTLTKYDLLTGEVMTLAKGPGNLKEESLTYYELSNPVVKHEITFSQERILLRRFAEIESETELLTEGIGHSHIHSPYGTMMVETELKGYEKGNDYYLVEYVIKSDGEIVSHQKMLWEIK